ncbi:hypothetical protein EVAR_61722_1 [Eumeta japonica]|uniref:RNA-directed DNA polymerase from mobile element jockey n=1 Tax=Eumeta variegata TaxID=151549 RepID=A0A4C1ZMQ9_EUMVA|nr:hypothetical protein EVAR_61722_1 [Eumeta japonica]
MYVRVRPGGGSGRPPPRTARGRRRRPQTQIQITAKGTLTTTIPCWSCGEDVCVLSLLPCRHAARISSLLFLLRELAIRHRVPRSRPEFTRTGPQGPLTRELVKNPLLKSLADNLLSLLVAMFNACLQNVIFPAWKEAEVIGIHKPGKPRDLLPVTDRSAPERSGYFERVLKLISVITSSGKA